jgi:hypothetical protein
MGNDPRTGQGDPGQGNAGQSNPGQGDPRQVANRPRRGRAGALSHHRTQARVAIGP